LGKICSRFYRAPEIIEGTGEYSTKIDIWSAGMFSKIYGNFKFISTQGCILLELVVGRPIFQSENDQEQIMEIYDIIGEPQQQNLKFGNFQESKQARVEKKIKGKGWSQVIILTNK